MTSLSDKEKILKEPLSLYEQEAFYKKDVKECIRNIKDKMFRYIKDNHKCLGIGCPHCLNWAVCKAIIEEETGKELCSDTLKGIKEESE